MCTCCCVSPNLLLCLSQIGVVYLLLCLSQIGAVYLLLCLSQIGISLGGFTALISAADLPEQVIGVALLNSAGQFGSASRDTTNSEENKLHKSTIGGFSACGSWISVLGYELMLLRLCVGSPGVCAAASIDIWVLARCL
ncbi:hypothetical protein FRX31_032011 [Thalictrum thalictroides]|uniref:Uncharacterized protein n=1 Tax=Thalictrum thalictroides TaxID=46969 RepID=A0A7J6V218_THATH|nr:hypothetical protein FRX31_032011 [Thalictrum thalictroides]